MTLTAADGRRTGWPGGTPAEWSASWTPAPGASTSRPGAAPAGPPTPRRPADAVRDRLGDQDRHRAGPGRAGRIRHGRDWTLRCGRCCRKGRRCRGTAATEITLEHLARHTSGLPRAPTSFAQDVWVSLARAGTPTPTWTRRPCWTRWPGSGCGGLRAPGRGRDSNFGAGLLGIALRRAAGADELRRAGGRTVLRPLGLVDTVVSRVPEQSVRLAQGHGLVRPTGRRLASRGAGRGRRPAVHRARSAQLPPGRRWIPTPPHWPRPSAGPTSRRSPERPRPSDWAGCAPLTAGDLWWHNGGTGGFRGFAGFSPQRRRAVAVLVNDPRGPERTRSS